MKKTVIAFIGVGAVAAGVWYVISSNTSPEQFASQDDAVARVNGEAVSRSDFEELQSQIAAQQGIELESLGAEEKDQLETQAADTLITQLLLQQAAQAAGMTASQEEIAAQLDATKANLGGEEAFQQALALEGLSEEELRKQMEVELAIQSYLEQELELSAIAASDEEIETTYNQAAAQDENIPVLEEVRDQVEGFVIQEKRQALVVQLVQRLREEADIQILL